MQFTTPKKFYSITTTQINNDEKERDYFINYHKSIDRKYKANRVCGLGGNYYGAYLLRGQDREIMQR